MASAGNVLLDVLLMLEFLVPGPKCFLLGMFGFLVSGLNCFPPWHEVLVPGLNCFQVSIVSS